MVEFALVYWKLFALSLLSVGMIAFIGGLYWADLKARKTGC